MADSCPDSLELLEAAVESCVGCGFCLEACPTYLENGHEADSPRGRIALVDGLMNDLLEVTPEAVRHLDLCLGCRACEAACPSGVPYGSILERGRDWLRRRPGRRKSGRDRILEFALTFILPKPGVLKLLAFLLKLSHFIGLFSLAARLPLPAKLKELLPLTPTVDGPAYIPRDRSPQGSPTGQSALFLGCVQQQLFPQVHESTAALLQASGKAVLHPKGQGCCGALHLHNGYLDQAKALARKNIDAFMNFLIDHPEGLIVVNAAGCGSTLKEYGHLFEGEPEEKVAKRVAGAVRDWSEVVTSAGFPGSASKTVRVAYQDACHLAHAQGIEKEPRALLEAHPGIDLVPLNDGALCCGSAGIYNIMEPEMAKRLQEKKIQAIEKVAVDYVASSNPGCLLQIRAGLKDDEARSAPEAIHPTTLLTQLGLKDNS